MPTLQLILLAALINNVCSSSSWREPKGSVEMLVRPAQMEDADQAIDVVRRSILELCVLDHQGDPATLSMWLSNKTADNMRQWIDARAVLVAIESERIAGVAAIRADGYVLLNYVAPEKRFKGTSKSLIHEIEVWASHRGLKWLTLDSTVTALRFYLSCGWTMTGPPQPGFGVTTRHPMGKAVTFAP
ncbi:GNAT family N-acetyltransferase [Bradyrhizobium sp. UFLA05-109]